MVFLKEKEIIEVITDYINDPLDNFAVLIDGEWGSGKTYFVKEKLCPHIDKIQVDNGICMKAIYVSLFGVSSQNMIDDLIYSKALELDLGNKAKVLPFLKRVIYYTLEEKGEKIAEDIDKLYRNLAFFETIVFIFDDLERCSMPINDIIGYINFLVEHCRFKLIIIANQKEIGKMRLYDNLEGKYLVACQGPIRIEDICDNDSSKEQLLFNDKKNNNAARNDGLSIEELKARAEFLFKEDELYFLTKEKLIGQTIYFKPELDEIFPIMADSYVIGDMAECIKASATGIINMMESQNHCNLRTLQYIFQFLRKISYQKAFENFEYKWRIDVYKNIIMAVTRTAIKSKRGEKPNQWDTDAEYGTQSDGLYVYYESFKFIDDYVSTSSFSPERIDNVLVNYYNEKKNSYDNSYDIVNNLGNYYMMEDEEVEELLLLLYRKFYMGEFRPPKYAWIISTLISIESCGFTTRLDEMVEQMEKIIHSYESVVELDSRRYEVLFELKDEDNKRYRTYMERITNAAKLKEETVKVFSLNSLFEEDVGWGKGIYQYYNEHKGEVLTDKKLLADIDMDMLISKLDNASAKDFTDFRLGIISIYRPANISDYLINDKPNLVRMYEHFKEREYIQKVKNMNRKYFIGNLEEILSRL